MLFISATIKSQTTTFTATNVRVTDTLRTMNVMYAQTVRANDTLRCMSGVVAEKDVRVDGTLNLTGDINAPITSTANLGEVVAKGQLTVAGNATFNGGLKLAPLTGTSDRLLYVDPLGNLKTSASTAATGPFWETIGNAGTNPSINSLGTIDQQDLVIKTSDSERMRVLANGDIYFRTGAGMVLKSAPNILNPPFSEILVGIGTQNPVRSFHIYTEHISVVNPNPDPNFLAGTHNGMRLEDVSGTTLLPVKSIWDILPHNKNLLFSKADPADPHVLNVKMIIADNGNVGIGNTAPLAKLHVSGTGIFSGKVGIGTNAPTGKLEVVETAQDQYGLVVGDLSGKSLMVVPNLGTAGYNPLSNSADVGIIFRNQNGNPGNAGLTIAPHSAVNSGIRITSTGYLGVGTSNPTSKLTVDAAGGEGLGIICMPTPNTKAISVFNNNSHQYVFSVYPSGYTHIGSLTTANPAAGYKLTVDGKIGSREVLVSLQNPWPDYVFEKNYKLTSLDAVQAYVKENKHLPNIPAAAELNKNECSLNLGQMQSKQMEKIEELYLYLFEMKKEMEELKKENALLKKAIMK
ncbi:MAG: hypothetical protein HYX39_10825 [Bacteroidetes bacterium]|nr:hypothetical protein [Bacteroidota bacterium]